MATSDRLGATSVETFSSRLVIGGWGRGAPEGRSGAQGAVGDMGGTAGGSGGKEGKWGDIGASGGHLGAVGGDTWQAIWGQEASPVGS